MTPIELLYIGTLIIVGGTLGHLGLLHVAARISRKRSSLRSLSFHGLAALREIKQACPLTLTASDFESKLAGECKRSGVTVVQSSGFLNGIPKRSPAVEKQWSAGGGSKALHNLLVATQQQNNRSTYLGAKSYDKSNPCAQLFGWHKWTGEATLQLGGIAQVERNRNEVALYLVLHPADAHTVVAAGWGKEAMLGVLHSPGIMRQMTKGTEVVLPAPRNSSEVEDVFAKVLEAAVWFVAGLDREEDV